MHGRSRTSRATPIISTTDRRRPSLRRSGAVTWVDAHHAIVAHTTATGPDVVEIRPDASGSHAPAYLLKIAEEIGDRDLVLVLGPEAYRIELEREYVALFGHPDRLHDGESGNEEEGPELLARLDRLTGRQP